VTDGGYRALEHTADLAFELWATTEEGVLEQGMHAVLHTLTAGAELKPEASREVEVQGLDSEDRLVRWLNEIIFLCLVEGFLPCDTEIVLDGTDLRAKLRGEVEAHERIVTEIKSATYHGLFLHVSEAEARAQIVLDV